MKRFAFDLKKQLCSIGFLIPCILGLTFAMVHCITISMAYNNLYEEIIKMANEDGTLSFNPHFPIYTSFYLWIGNDQSSHCAKLLFGIMPLLVTFPFGWSYYSDLKKGKKVYLNNRQYIAKYISVFICSGLIIAFPLIVNFLGMLIFVPAIQPDSVYDIYYGIFSNEFLSSLFYNSPFIYTTTFIILNFTFYGLLGCLSFSLSQGKNQKNVILIIPAGVMPLVEGIKRLFAVNVVYEFSPMSFLFPANSHSSTLPIVLAEILLLFLVTFAIPILRGAKNEK